jgi:predicted nuclease with TOPRIM domain
LVESINSNTKTIAANMKNNETLDSNIENLEIHFKMINERFEKIENENRSNFNEIQFWSNEVVSAIEQLRNLISEKSDEVIINFLYQKLSYFNIKINFRFIT